MRKTSWAILALGLLVGLAPTVSYGATEAEKLTAIQNSLNWLAGQQQANGRWEYGAYDDAATAAVLLSFLEAPAAAQPANTSTIVSNGLNYLFSTALTTAVPVQTMGNPDVNGNALGVYWNNGNQPLYGTGMVIPAIVATGTPGAVVTVGPRAGQTYAQVVQDTADYLAFAQDEPNTGVYRGGWRYAPNSGSSDNSNSQWPTVGLLYAQAPGWGTVPGFVKSELDMWINYIQNPANGASGYTSPTEWNNPAKTGGLLTEMDLTAPGQPVADINAAVTYLNNMWLTSGSDGNFGDPYAMWGIYKGLEVTLGVDSSVIINLRNQAALRSGAGAPVDNPNHGWNWWEDYCEYAWSIQNANGSFPGAGSWVTGNPNILASAWYTNILNATQIPSGVIPEPVTVAGLVLGMGGLVRYIRRRK